MRDELGDPSFFPKGEYGILATLLVLITNHEVGKLNFGSALGSICTHKVKLGGAWIVLVSIGCPRRKTNASASETDVTT
jgi:hypothetical protein